MPIFNPTIDAPSTASTTNSIVKYADTTGTKAANSGVTIDGSNNVVTAGNITSTKNIINNGAGNGLDVNVAGNLEIGASVGANNITLGVTSSTVIVGNLQVNGTTTTVNSSTLDVADKNITVSKNGNDAASEGAGLTVDRTSTKGSLIYKNASATRFAIGDVGSEVDVVGLSSTQTLTNKTINGSSNTLSNIANSSLSNMANNTVKANKSGGSAAPSDLAISDFAETGSSIFTVSNGTKSVIGTSNLTVQANLNSAHIYVGNASNVPVDVAVSGDVSVTNTGATTVGTVGGSSASNIHSAELAANAATSANTASTLVKRDSNKNFQTNMVEQGVTTTATAAGTTTLTVSSTPIQQFTGSTTQTITLPDATTLNNGHWYEFLNGSSGALTIKNNGAATLATVNGSSALQFILISNGTSNGTWDFTGSYGNAITALTGDVTASGPGSATATLANTAVSAASYGSATQVGTFTVDAKGRLTAASNTSIALPASAITSGQLALARGGTNADLSATGGTSQYLKQASSGAAITVGTIAAADLPTIALTGNVTGSASGGSIATTIAAGVVTNAMQANMANNTVKGNISGGSSAPSDVALTNAATASTVMFRDSNINTRVNNAIVGFATTATAAGTTTLTVSSAEVQQFTGSTTQTVVLPDATTLVVGQSFTVINRSTGIVTVNKNGGALAFAVPAGAIVVYTVTAIGTSAGTWDAGGLQNPTSSTLGGIQSAAAVSNQWINSISTSGVPALSQPAFTNISGTATTAQGGTNHGNYTAGSIIFAGTSGTSLTEDNAALAWTDASKTLAITGVESFKSVTSEATLSAEFITATNDRTFAGAGNWTGTNWSVSGGAFVHTTGANVATLANANLTSAPISGHNYQLTFDVNTTTAGKLTPAFGGISTGSITVAVNGPSATFTRSSGSYVTDGFVVGENVDTSGFTNANNNNTFQISTLTATVMTVVDLIGMVTEASAAGRTIQTTTGIAIGQTVTNLTTQTQIINASGTSALSFLADTTWAGSIDNISIKEITSIPALQTFLNADGSAGPEIRSGASCTNLQNTFMGYRAGFLNTASSAGFNTGQGAFSLTSLTTGASNTAIGNATLASVTTGNDNVGVGDNAGAAITSGIQNVALGDESLGSNVYGSNNTAVGHNSLQFLSSNDNNTALGAFSLFNLLTGTGNVGLGTNAGYYETGSNKLWIDNVTRASLSDAQGKALVYGTFASTVASQILQFNASCFGGNINVNKFYADNFDSPNTANWTVNALAAAKQDATNSALTVRAFDDTIEEGVGFLLTIPTNATNIILTFKGRAATAPAGTRTVGVKLYQRSIPDNAAIGAWSNKVLTDLSIPTNANFQYNTQTIALSAFSTGLVAGNLYQWELTRRAPAAGTNLVGDYNLLEFTVSFS